MVTRQQVAHGALDHAELAACGRRPEELLDFSSNLNPFGPPPGVRAALAALDPAPYPDRSCLRLRQALAAWHGCEPEQVLAGNGSNELIHLLARALLRPGDRTLVVAPTFGEYAHASQLAQAQVAEWRADAASHFALDIAALQAQIQQLRPRLTWLCAPNNPTGVAVSPAELHTIAAACATHAGTLVVDCTYEALVRPSPPGPLSHLGRGGESVPSLPGALPSQEGERANSPPPSWGRGWGWRGTAFLELHSLTKSHALAGLRLGYLLGDADLLARVARYQPTWSVSSAAQAAGLAALADADFLPRTLPQLWAASDALVDGLRSLGLTVWRGALPFLLARTGNGAATRSALLERGYVVRDCASFGLPAWVRVAPRAPGENVRLIEAWANLNRRDAETQRF